MNTPATEALRVAMQRINQVWLDGRVEALAPMVDPDIVMVFPGCTGGIQGREPFLAGFGTSVRTPGLMSSRITIT